MTKAIKSWYSPVLGWYWHAKEDMGNGLYFGFVQGAASEWGDFTQSELDTAGASEIEPQELPEI